MKTFLAAYALITGLSFASRADFTCTKAVGPSAYSSFTFAYNRGLDQLSITDVSTLAGQTSLKGSIIRRSQCSPFSQSLRLNQKALAEFVCYSPSAADQSILLNPALLLPVGTPGVKAGVGQFLIVAGRISDTSVYNCKSK